MGQKTLMQSKVFEQAKKIMADTFEDTDIETEQKSHKRDFLEKKIGLPDSRVIEEIIKKGLKKYRPNENVRVLGID